MKKTTQLFTGILLSAITLLLHKQASAQCFGTGADGSVTITTTKNINTDVIASGRSYADGIAYRINAPADGAGSVTRYNGTVTISNGIAPGDEVMLISLQGAPGDIADVGNYEFMTVATATASTITFTDSITKSYDGTSASNQKVVIQRVPNYTDVTITNPGLLTASIYHHWDDDSAFTVLPTGAAGYYTAIVAFKANGTVIIGSSAGIDISSLGYFGGRTMFGVIKHGGGPDGIWTGTGVGGAQTENCGGSSVGRGGGYGTNGNGTGTGGLAYGNADLSTINFGGGGGGNGGGGDCNGNAGGRSGGIIYIRADSILVSGYISANGQDALPVTEGPVGGGSGGSIFISSDGITLGTGLVSATGGAGNGGGGMGGDGRIRIEYGASLSGTTSPAASIFQDSSLLCLPPNPCLSDTWTQKANFGGTARDHAVGFSIADKGYIGLGSDGTYKNDFWEYDPSSDTWTQKANFAGTARSQAKGFSIGNKGYVGLGTDGTYKNDFYEYDPNTNAWTQKANFGGAARQYAVGFSIGNKGYMGTGWNGTYLTDFWEYDTTSNSWTQKADFGGTSRYGAVGFSIGSKGYVGTGKDGGLTSDFWEYNPASNNWTQKANYGGGPSAHGVGFFINSFGYIGTGEAPYTNEFWQYDTTSNTWNQKANFGGSARTIAVGFSINSSGYIGTGLDGSGTNDFWEYTLVQTTNLNTTICASDSIFLQGAYQTTTGTYYDTLTAINSCDSIIATTLTVNPAYNISDSPLAICNGDSALIYGTYRTAAGTYYDSLITINGCDSVHSTVLTVNPTYTISDSPIIICNGDSSLIYGTYRNSSGTYYDSLATVNGCDSVHFTALTVNPKYSISDSPLAICNGDSSLIYGTYRTTAGTYYDSLISVNGCDSVHSTVLTVNPTYNISDSPLAICNGDSALIYGTYRTTAGTYYDSLATVNGCDSVHSKALTVNPTYSISDSPLTICNGDSALIYGTFRTTAGTYYDSLTTVNGCDSVHSTVLTVNPTYSISDSPLAICNGDSALIYGTYRTTAGTYYDSLISVNGCDSVHSTVLTVNPTYNISDSPLAICNGDSSLIYGTYRTAAGTYYDSLTTVSGCDSVHSTALTVNPTYNISDSPLAICNGDSALIYGTYRTTAGTYYDSLATVNGCDSVHSTALTVNPTYSISDSPLAVCNGDSALIYGAYRTISGTYYDSLATVDGCDSVHTTLLTVNPTFSITDAPVAICSGDSALIYGTYRNSAGTYYDSLTTVSGCDSVHSTALTVNPLPALSVSTSNVSCYGACDGSVTVNAAGGNPPYTYLWTSSLYPTCQGIPICTILCGGTDTVIVTDLSGCASTAVVIITVPPLLQSSSSAAICDNDSIFLEGAYQTAPGTYFDTLTAVNGCDSVHSTILTVNLIYSISDSPLAICNGDSALIYGTYRTIAGTYYDSLTTVDGCDSVHSTALTVNPMPTLSVSTSNVSCYGACDGSVTVNAAGGNPPYTYLWTSSLYPTCQGIPICTILCGGTDTVIVTDLSGCASTAVVIITVPPLLQSSSSAAICDNDSIFLEGAYQTAPGTYFDTLTAINGCDSVHSTTLSVNPLPAKPAISQSGNSLGASTAASYQWYYFDTLLTGATSQFLNPSKSGFYAVEITDANGCSAMSDPFDFTLSAIGEHEDIYGLTIFPNPNNGTFTIKLMTPHTENLTVKVYNTIGQVIFKDQREKLKGNYEKQLNLKDYPAGVYKVQVQAEQGTLTRQMIIE